MKAVRSLALFHVMGDVAIPCYNINVTWSSDDSAFIADIPELPGCRADGTTYKEAVSNAKIVIGGWIETAIAIKRVIPMPKTRVQ